MRRAVRGDFVNGFVTQAIITFQCQRANVLGAGNDFTQGTFFDLMS